MPMQMVDFSTAFPKRIAISDYMPIINAAKDAAVGKDGQIRVVIQDYETHKLAIKAANAIRAFSQNHELHLRVSCSENSNKVMVYKGIPRKPSVKKDSADAKPAVEVAEPKPAVDPAAK